MTSIVRGSWSDCPAVVIKNSLKNNSVIRGVVGHRGAREKAPENTIASFQQAVDDGADSVELDVQLSKDGVYVVIHDDTLDRTTNGSGPVKEHTLAELKSLDAGSWFGDQSEFKGERIPTLEESLEWAQGRTKVDIEVKQNPDVPMTSRSLINLIKAKGMEGQVAVTSFDRKFVEAVEARAPEIETGVLLSAKPTFQKAKKGAVLGLGTGFVTGLLATGSVLSSLGIGLASAVVGGIGGLKSGLSTTREVASQTEADAILPNQFIATKSVVEAAHEKGKTVVPYTVNNSLVAKVLLSRGVDGLVTDRPQDFL